MDIKHNSLSDQLSTGTQSFEKLITEGRIYVDKTQHVHRLLKGTGQYFLSRPRRFGKSLLVSTLQALFEGKKELFKNTDIDSTDYDWQPYPVIKLDMSSIDDATPDLFKKSLVDCLADLAAKSGCAIQADSKQVKKSFSDVISCLAEKYNKPVVILIDEYDAPILNTITNLEQAERIRDILKGFYTVLKSQNHNIKFLFITGITRFSRVSIFSGLNNLNDLSQDQDFADFLGYTQEELEKDFVLHIEQLMRTHKQSRTVILERIKEWYNGYRFTKKEMSVYNPVSSMRLFQTQEFENYWFNTATPSFLVDLMRENPNWEMSNYDDIEIDLETVMNFELEHLEFLPLLFQAGYLTIKNHYLEYGESVYRLGFPNHEVRKSFLKSLVLSFSNYDGRQLRTSEKGLMQSLENKNLDTYIEIIKSFIAAIPSHLHIAREAYYHSMINVINHFLGVKFLSEQHSSLGRMDGLVETSKYIYIFEFKFERSTAEALKKIKEKGYYEQFLKSGKDIYLVAIKFSKEQRNIIDHKVERLDLEKSFEEG